MIYDIKKEADMTRRPSRIKKFKEFKVLVDRIREKRGKKKKKNKKKGIAYLFSCSAGERS